MASRGRIADAVSRFLYPGINLKRWGFLLFVSSLVLFAGASGILGDAFTGRRFHIQPVRKLEKSVRDYWKSLRAMDRWLIVLGGVGMVFAVRRGYYAILAVVLPRGRKDFIRLAYERARRKRGPKVVAIGGGTGMPNLLLGLKEYTDNLTAIVTVADDGGSSGRLRKQFGMIPPGDFRNCLVALADEAPIMGRLFQHRFGGKGELSGHAFGNLFLAALAQTTGDFSRGLAESHRVLAVRGRVVPVTLESLKLTAKLTSGKIVKGESRIKTGGAPVERLSLVPARPKANPDALKALRDADIVCFGPGSLWTSVVPNVLVPEIREALGASRALKVYVCNIMTEPGETDTLRTASQHVEALQKYLDPGTLDAVIVNAEPPNDRLLTRYRREGATLVEVDEQRLRDLGLVVIRGKLLGPRADYIRHDPAAISRVVIKYAVI